jgi:hypothetical protein
MNYEKRKEWTAILSITSVAMGMSASVITLDFVFGSVTKSFTLITTAAAIVAACAAVMSIVLSRRLARERDRRRVFIVYAREDLNAARKLAEDLKENGFNPWLDVDEITPGQVWQKAVLRSLEESATALVLVSQHLSKKGFVQDELKAALDILQERQKDVSPVVPVRLDDSPVPERLSHIQWVNLFEENGLGRLIAGLDKIVKSTQRAATANRP